MNVESFLPEVRYVGPGDNEIRTGAPEYLGGKIYPSNPEAAAALRTFWEEEHKKRPKKRTRRPAGNNVAVNLARALHERRKAREEKVVDTARSKMGPQEEARLEMLIRSESSDEELQRFRRQLGIHHKTFLAAVKRIQARIEKGNPPIPMAAQIQEVTAAADPGTDGDTALAVLPPPPPQIETVVMPASVDPLVSWLTTLRSMRDELAAHGVVVEGSLRIQIDL